MPHLSVEARTKAAPDRGSLKRGRPVVDVVDLVEDPDNPRVVPRSEGRNGEKNEQMKNERRRRNEERAKKERKKLNEKKETKKPENRWDICDECYSVPFPSDATMFCLKCKNNFRVWYELCNELSALDRNSKMWEECFPED